MQGSYWSVQKADHLLPVPHSQGFPEQPLVVELSARLQLMDKQHLDMATVLQEKGWARKVEVKEGDIREIGLASLVHVVVPG